MTEGTEDLEMTEPLEPAPDAVTPDSAQEMPASAEEPVVPSEENAAADAEPEIDVVEPEVLAEEAQLTETGPDEQDEVTAAIVEAGANFEGDAPLEAAVPDEPAPAAEPQRAEPTEVPAPTTNKVSSIPFVIYDLLWVVFAALLVWRFIQIPQAQAVFESSLYPLAVLGGLVLTIAGPLLIVAVWIGSWKKDGSSKLSLFVSALVRGSIATLLGVALWWGALVLLDQLRLGRLL
ncbi:MAG: hypothetical protein CVT67_03255 [Actinobacteria bacterium HGW-Actinobacteria-7]|nr:MAG: hypothetical protein CVT67_03255 [Actinobacteria bacterium HGW-Actinobacteria-7]